MNTTLVEYIQNHGFVHGDIWYFRTTWMSPLERKALEAQGIIKKTGTGTTLRAMGIKIPARILNYRQANYGWASLFYEVNKVDSQYDTVKIK